MEKKNTDNKRNDAEVKVELKEFVRPISHGENVKHYRKMKGYSQDYMAAALKISQSKYSEIERMNTIEDQMLIKIAGILNLGVEWLKEIPIQKGTTIYNQDGNGTNFQNTGDVNYTINNPVEEVKTAYQNTVQIIKETFDNTIEDKNQTIKDLKEDNKGLMDRLFALTDSIRK